MKGFVLIVVLQLGVCYAEPVGVGAYAYQDSLGNRYGGTYDLDPDASGPETVGPETNFIGPFGNFQDPDTFFPVYFRNFENFLQHLLTTNESTRRGSFQRSFRRAFGSNIANQRLASYAAQRAYDLTYRVHHSPPFFRFPNFGPMNSIPLQPKFGTPNFGPNFGPDFGPNYGPSRASNSAFASSAVGSGGIHQVAAINPPSKKSQNVDVSSKSLHQPGDSNYYGVSSSSFASSSNVDGKTSGMRRAETVVNDNGRITRYKVED